MSGVRAIADTLDLSAQPEPWQWTTAKEALHSDMIATWKAKMWENTADMAKLATFRRYKTAISAEQYPAGKSAKSGQQTSSPCQETILVQSPYALQLDGEPDLRLWCGNQVPSTGEGKITKRRLPSTNQLADWQTRPRC